MSSSARRHVLLFTKPAVPGRVKTRLAGRLGEKRAAELHAAFVRDVTSSLQEGDFGLTVAWALSDDVAEPPVAALDLAPGLPWVRQEGDGLGDRLYRALADAARDADLVAAVGSDHPEIDPSRVDDAFRRLESRRDSLSEKGADLVLGPVPDGGYDLVALRAAVVQPRLFEDIPWSTDAVLDATLERARELDLRAALLPEGYDVDVPEDLDELVRRLARPPGSRAADSDARCPATRALLEEWGLLEAEVEGDRIV